MPKHDPMAQLSRPFQIALAVVVLFAGVWLFALQGRFTSTSTSGSGSSASVSSGASSSSAPAGKAAAHGSASTAPAKAPGTSTHVYHGPVPGLEGLTRDVSRAHKAVAATGEAPQTPSTTAAPQPSGAAAVKTAAPAATTAAPAVKTSTTVPTSTVHKTSTATHAASGAATLSGQRTVEAELKKGDVVLLLFWNPNGTDDVVVHRAVQQVQRAGRNPRQPIAVQEAPASQVASYGSVTRGVQVYATPTLFVINKRGQAIVLTGVQDAFSIEQAISEARSS